VKILVTIAKTNILLKVMKTAVVAPSFGHSGQFSSRKVEVLSTGHVPQMCTSFGDRSFTAAGP